MFLHNATCEKVWDKKHTINHHSPFESYQGYSYLALRDILYAEIALRSRLLTTSSYEVHMVSTACLTISVYDNGIHIINNYKRLRTYLHGGTCIL